MAMLMQNTINFFEQALKSLNEKERSEIYLKLSEKINRKTFALPLFQYTTPVYISPTIMGAKKIQWASFTVRIYGEKLKAKAY